MLHFNNNSGCKELQEIFRDLHLTNLIFQKIMQDQDYSMLQIRLSALSICIEICSDGIDQEIIIFLLDLVQSNEIQLDIQTLAIIINLLTTFINTDNYLVIPENLFSILFQILQNEHSDIITSYIYNLTQQLIEIIPDDSPNFEFVLNFLHDILMIKYPEFKHEKVDLLLTLINKENGKRNVLHYIDFIESLIEFADQSYLYIFRIINQTESLELLTEPICNSIFDCLSSKIEDEKLMIELFSMFNVIISNNPMHFYNLFLSSKENLCILMNSLNILISSSEFTLLSISGRLFSIIFIYFPQIYQYNENDNINLLTRLSQSESLINVILIHAIGSIYDYLQVNDTESFEKFYQNMIANEVIENLNDYLDDLDDTEVVNACSLILDKFASLES